jgi:hypothetical protein
LFREWEIEQKLDAAEDPNNPFPARGQIRLLSKKISPPVIEQPVYVAIISDWEDGLVLVAPFTTFQAPATTGEVFSGRSDPPLKVLSLTATISASPFLLTQSWFVDTLSEEQMTQIWHVFRHITTGAELPDSVQAKVGAPIINPLDPRIRHEQEMVSMLAPLRRMTAVV